MKVQLAVLMYALVSLAFATSANASPIGGRKVIRDTIGRGMQTTYDVVLKDGEQTMFTINGNGRSDLDCFLYDENGELVGKDDDATDTCVVSITPKWAGHFSFVVRNVGDKVSVYTGSAF